MTNKNIEVEIRGKLPKLNVGRIFDFLESKAKFLRHYFRLSVDISPGFDPKTKSWKSTSKLDLRVKKSGSEEKISLKIGAFHGKNRREVEVKIEEGQFLNALYLFVALGYDKGMVYFCENWEYRYQDFEIKISKCSNDYYTWEIESLSKDSDPHSLSGVLRLKPYSKEEYEKAVKWENKNIHKIFSTEIVERLLKIFTNKI